MECIAIGDLHLTTDRGRGGLASYLPDPDDFVRREVQKAVDWAKRKNISTVLFLGDLCEGTRMSYAGHLALDKLFKENPDITFCAIPGNHDLESADPSEGHSLQLLEAFRPPNLKLIMQAKTVKFGQQRIRFLPYPHADFDKRALNIAHIEVRGSKSDSGRKYDGEGLSKSNAVILAGHLHTHHVVRNTYYAGTLYQTNFGESLPKGFLHVQFEDADDFEISFVQTKPEYTLHTCILQSRKDLANVPTGEKQLVRLILQDGCDVSAADYGKMKNVVKHNAFRTKEELVAVLTEDVADGAELVIRTDDFFNQWLQASDVEDEMRSRTVAVRQRVLASFKKGGSNLKALKMAKR